MQNNKINITHWGKASDTDVYLFRITNSLGNYVELSNYGATVVSIFVPDKFGKVSNVALGYSDLQGYLSDKYYLGSTIGRYTNRIGKARFVLEGREYELEKNDGENSLHGGNNGFNRRVFDFEIKDNTVVMYLLDEGGNGGYPGTLEFEVTFTWTDKNELLIDYTAETDRPTIANFTNHTYFNFSWVKSPVTNHFLWVNSGVYLAQDDDHVPTGKMLVDNEGFLHGRLLSDVIDKSRPLETGLDRYFLLQKEKGLTAPQAALYEPKTGRQLQVFTSYPGMIVYTGQFLNTIPDKNGQFFKPLSGICLECHHFPDSVNHQQFPWAILSPEKPYKEFIKFSFDIK